MVAKNQPAKIESSDDCDECTMPQMLQMFKLLKGQIQSVMNTQKQSTDNRSSDRQSYGLAFQEIKDRLDQMNDAIQAFSGNIVDEAMKDENEQIEVQYTGNHLFHTKPNNKYTGCGIHFNG